MIARRLRRRKGLAATALAVAAIMAGAVIAVVTPAGPAVAFFSPPLLLKFHILSPATLVARGAGVDVPVQIECAGASGPVFVDINSVTERVGKDEIATGSGSKRVACTGSTQTTVVLVFANFVPFRKGTAIADGDIFACAPGFCGSDFDTEVISITK